MRSLRVGDVSAASHPFYGDAVRVVEMIHAHEGLLPSIYLRRGERLRCVAVRGYHQVLDGLRVGHGVAGVVAATGQAQVISDTGAHEHFLAAVDELQSEVCLPLRAAGQVVGVFNVEARRAMTPPEIDMVTGCGDELNDSLARNGMPSSTPAQLLAHHAEAITRATASVAVEGHLLDAALELSGMSTAAMALRGPDGLAVVSARGPLAPQIGELGEAPLQDILSWVQEASAAASSHPDRSTWLKRAADAGVPVGSVSVVALRARERGLGMLICADAQRIEVPTDVTEVLEVLGAVGAAALSVNQSLTDLRRRALHDSLTGLGNRANLEAEVDEALQDRREQPIALLLIDVDNFKQVNDAHGHVAGDRLLVELAGRMQESLRESDSLFRVGGDEFAALVRVRDERDAQAVGQRLCAAARAAGSTASIGAVVTRPDETSTLTSMMVTADASLYDVKGDGRDGVRVAGMPPANG